ncbi:MAG: DUF4838 domain-containing protein [Lentisphaerae bacterium]|nr:DUF4838 domain-containing protein [Lentisphaerota bacterium]
MVSFRRRHVTLVVGLFFCCLLPAVGLAADRSGAAGLVLVRDRAPAASIVIAEEANRAARFAATELQYHVELITGAKLPILPKARNHVEDLSGKGNSGLIFGLGKGVAREEDGEFGTVLSFNAAEGQNWVANGRKLDLPVSFTVVLWLKPEHKADGPNGILHAPSYLLRMSLNKDNNKAYVRLKLTDGTYQSYRLTREAVPEDKWTCLAFSYDGEADVLKGYRDGKMVMEHAKIGGIRREDWQGRLLVGNGLNIGGTFKGLLGEVRVYDRVAPDHCESAQAENGPVVQWTFGLTEPSRADGARILVGESEATRKLGLRNEDFAHQEYLIRFLPDALVLMGRDKADRGAMSYAAPGTFPGKFDDQASCYAVYDFLERYCDVRWYLPTELGMACPRTATLAVKGADVRRAPAMKYRELHRVQDMPADLTDESGPRLDGREGLLFAHRLRLTGVQQYACNHAFYGYYRRFLKDHPEWFAKGYDEDVPEDPSFATTKRGGYDHNGYPMKYYPNMCFTDDGFVRQVTTSARHFFDTGRSLGGELARGDYFTLGPMDSTGKDKFCRCPECQTLLHEEPPCNAWRKQYFFFDDLASDYIFNFVNKVARGVGETHPGKYVTMFAYHQTYYPPTHELLEPNIAITFCMHAQLRPVPAMDRAITELLDRWDEQSPNQPKYLWLYFHRPGRVNPFFPGFMAHHMVKQMQEYHRRGFRGIFAEPAYVPIEEKGHAGRVPNANLLEIYIAYKLADDPTLDGNKLIDEFFTHFYGAAAKPMQTLYEAIERVYCDPANYTFSNTYFGYQSKEIAWNRLGTEERMAEFAPLMARARNAAVTGTEKKRVALFETSIWKRMKAGRAEYLASASRKEDLAKAHPLQSYRAVRIVDNNSGGDLANVDWSKADVLTHWYSLTAGEGIDRKLEARLLHDGAYLYVQMQETMTSDAPAYGRAEEWWQLCFGRSRGTPYRDMWINGKAKHVDLTIGGKSREWDSGAAVVSKPVAPNCWQVQVALPLAKLLPGTLSPGDTLCMNIIRIPADKSAKAAWNATFTNDGYEPSRFGDLELAP